MPIINNGLLGKSGYSGYSGNGTGGGDSGYSGISGYSGSSSGGYNFEKDIFDITNIDISNKYIDIAYTPITNSEIIAWNGIILSPGINRDYTILTNRITFTNEIIKYFTNNDVISVSYSR